MKSFCILIIIALSLNTSIASAQEVNHAFIKGTWQYKSPKGKSKLAYQFDDDQKFSSTIERKETEVKTDGSYELDKKGELDRLILSIEDKTKSANTIITYYFIKPIGADTLKLQSVNDKELTWSRETKRNTMVFVRKKEKPKE